MDCNKVILIGRVGERGPKLTYDDRATPTCSFTLEVDEVSPTGKVFTSYIPVEVVGKYVEAAAERLEPGQEVMIDGKLKYKKVTDKRGQVTSKLIVSTWGVTAAPVPTGKAEG
jgi:single-stranded DNA-binding protein